MATTTELQSESRFYSRVDSSFFFRDLYLPLRRLVRRFRCSVPCLRQAKPVKITIISRGLNFFALRRREKEGACRFILWQSTFYLW